jgi:hypothetical protein
MFMRRRLGRRETSNKTRLEVISNKLSNGADDCRGIYVIRRNGSPFYVGLSNGSVKDRLIAHFSGTGSSKIAEQLGQGSVTLSYEWLCLDNPEQAESELIKELGTYPEGNLRRETDPADRYPTNGKP